MKWSVLVESAVCKKCKIETKHRTVNDTRPGRKPYLACSICLENNSKKHRQANWFRYLAQKANARKRPGSIKMKEQYLLDLLQKQNGRCALSQIVFDIKSEWDKPSLDRIDSDKGYTLNNIRLVTWRVNHCKGSLTDAEFTDMCIDVARSQND